MQYYLAPKEKTILILLFTYRGMRAKDLAVFYTESYDYTLSDEKSIYNYLSKMKCKGLIKSHRLQGVHSLGSIYYLTQAGTKLAKELLNITVGQQGTGLLPVSEQTVFWDIPFDYQTPPLKQTGHFLMTIEFFKRLITSEELLYHRTTYYSNLTYESEQKARKVKPDASVTINGNYYAVEVDRATESHEQLLAKFQKYKEYHDFCEQAKDKTEFTPVHTILFVVEERSRQHGIKRRWTNVLSAFFKAFGEDFPPINLILVPMDEVGQTLEFEMYRAEKEEEVYNILKGSVANTGFDTVRMLGNYPLAFNKETGQGKTLVPHLHLEFESRIYKDNYDANLYVANFSNSFNHLFGPGKEWGEIEYINGTALWVTPFNMPKYPVGIETTGIHPELAEKMKSVANCVDRYRIYNQSN